MQKWEYKMIREHTDMKTLNELGEDGWEMCGTLSGMGADALFFKRPKIPEKRTTTLNVQPIRMEQITDEQKDNLIKVKPRKQEDNENKDTDYWK